MAFIKIADIRAADNKSLNQITEKLEDAGFTIAYDKEYEDCAYVCVVDEAEIKRFLEEMREKTRGKNI